ncbi:hypothetical protein BSU00_10940 [Tenacibaculum sp. SG-28]|nr:hypothetical protein BSU00_10940 [Tenacibaculum sp. SG-28]
MLSQGKLKKITNQKNKSTIVEELLLIHKPLGLIAPSGLACKLLQVLRSWMEKKKENCLLRI